MGSFWRVLYFDFFQDDSLVFWIYNYKFTRLYEYFKHPGTPMEIYLLYPLFGLDAVYWEWFGISLKIITAVLMSIFLYKLTNSKLAAYLSGLFSTVSICGMDIITTPLYNVAAIAGILILVTLISLLKFLRGEESHSWKFFLFLAIAIFMDPARVIPIFGLLPFFLFLFPNSRYKVQATLLFQRLFIWLSLLGPVFFLWWYVQFSSGSQIEIFIKGMLSNPQVTFIKMKYLGNYFATIANLFFEIFYGLRSTVPYLATAEYDKKFGLVGIGLLGIGILLIYLFLRFKKRSLGIISVFILWSFIFYIPNWFAEPRVPMSSENHYLFISGIGSICCFSFLISLVKKKLIVIFLVGIFILANIYKANTLLNRQLLYRSSKLNMLAWKTILQDTQNSTSNKLFFFSGDVSWIEATIIPWGNIRYLLLRHDPDISHMPILTIDREVVTHHLCNDQPLELFAWDVIRPGILINRTQEIRSKFSEFLNNNDCKIPHKSLMN